LLAIIATIAGATVAANLALLILDMRSDRHNRPRTTAGRVKESQGALV
jgi:hypothetical protein